MQTYRDAQGNWWTINHVTGEHVLVKPAKCSCGEDVHPSYYACLSCALELEDGCEVQRS